MASRESRKSAQKKKALVSQGRIVVSPDHPTEPSKPTIEFSEAELTKEYESPKLYRDGDEPPKQIGQWLGLYIGIERQTAEVVEFSSNPQKKRKKE